MTSRNAKFGQIRKDAMSSQNMKTIINSISAHGKMRLKTPATETEINSFEEKYEIKLPEQYKEWLLYSDGGELFLPAGFQLYGVSHNPIIDIHDMWCPDEKYLAIGAMSWGDSILCEKDSEAISIYNHETGKIKPDEVYACFYDFLEDAVHIYHT